MLLRSESSGGHPRPSGLRRNRPISVPLSTELRTELDSNFSARPREIDSISIRPFSAEPHMEPSPQIARQVFHRLEQVKYISCPANSSAKDSMFVWLGYPRTNSNVPFHDANIDATVWMKSDPSGIFC
jgi:hypothetical protein